ncbi:hypothetical protein I4F81_004985 [Pyropia yezoensis]|uniref:Uncharacterized protein n=1 Tax=Pyropia yezoensis TaxID=2788 RepID=A0ACC3BWK0_PYRYE|nr:hypothetical protein I4F81_004985 [Neopyropia yezoensis]
MEDQFSRAAIDAVYVNLPSIRGYILPAGTGTGTYSIYPRPYPVRNDTEFARNSPDNCNTHREATALYTTCAWLGEINNGLRTLEKHLRRDAISTVDAADHVATWRTAVYQLFSCTSASYDILILLRKDRHYANNLYRDMFLHRTAGRDSPAVARYNWLAAACADLKITALLGSFFAPFSTRGGAATAAYAIGVPDGRIVALLGLQRRDTVTGHTHYSDALVDPCPAARRIFDHFLPRP